MECRLVCHVNGAAGHCRLVEGIPLLQLGEDVKYWNQFADEGEVKDAEAKIWSATATRAMRWKNVAGVHSTGPTQSVTDLLFTSYKDNLAGYTGSNIRILGHSLGNQIAIALTKKINDSSCFC